MPLLVSDRVCAGPPAFGVPLSESWPSLHAQPAAEVARRAVEALGIVRGAVARAAPSRAGGGPEVLQVSARLGANHEAELVALATGVDLNRLALAAALAVAPALRPSRSTSARARSGGDVRFLVAPPGAARVGRGCRRALKGVAQTWIYRETGYVFGPLRRPSDRAGAVLVAGASREEAVARAADGGRTHTLRRCRCRGAGVDC